MPRWVVTMWRMFPAVGGASLAAVLGLWLARQGLDQSALRDSNNEVGNYIQALGGIYAVVAAFVVYVVWGQFNDARTQVEREASEVVDLFRLADGFPEHDRIALQTKLARYVATVLDEEWSALARNDDGPVERCGSMLDEVWDILHGCEPATECHRALHAEALSRYNDLSDVRTARLSSARMRIPTGLRLLLYFGGLILVGSMYLLAVERFWIHALITACLAGAVSHILYIVNDLDNSFSGDWQVPRKAFERVQGYMARRSPAAAAVVAAAAARTKVASSSGTGEAAA